MNHIYYGKDIRMKESMDAKYQTTITNHVQGVAKSNRDLLNEAVVTHLGQIKNALRVYVYRFGLAEGGSVLEAVADEILEITLETAVKLMDEFDPNLNPYSWLLTIAINALRNYRRKIFREEKHVDTITDSPAPKARNNSDLETDWSTMPEDEKLEHLLDHRGQTSLEDELFGVDDLLSLVNKNDRTVLRLAYVDGMGEADLAAVLNVSHGAAAMRLSRARKRLFDAYQKSEYVVRKD